MEALPIQALAERFESLLRKKLKAGDYAWAHLAYSVWPDGVFEIDESEMPEGPVFLIDDLVDSRWTFTVIAALLRKACCPAVFPLALAMSSHHSD